MRAHRDADGKEVASMTCREVSSIIGGSGCPDSRHKELSWPPKGYII